jgi:hypothetical protein
MRLVNRIRRAASGSRGFRPMGALGAGVGVAPPESAEFGYSPLPGHTNPASATFGNYLYTDGSIMVWIPAFRVRWGSPASPQWAAYGENACDVVGVAAHDDEAHANSEGFYLHRAFINGGAIKTGFFHDKFKCSNNSGVASSIQNRIPVTSAGSVGMTPFNTLNGSPPNALHGSIPAARTRGSQFFPATIFARNAIATIAMAHGQNAKDTSACAWYGVNNYPKGCNLNLADADDASVTFTWSGVSGQPALALIGSASQPAKTTHNGQLCGVFDVNGLGADANPGVTSNGTLLYALKPSVNITTVDSGVSSANDLWGTAGIAALYDQLDYTFTTSRKYGDGANRVFGWESPSARALTMAGMPLTTGVSTAGSGLFGADQAPTGPPANNACPISGGYRVSAASAGVNFLLLSRGRNTSDTAIGFTSMAYLP